MAFLPEYPNGTTVTVGMFDGVHRGHQAVLREIVDRARVAGRTTAEPLSTRDAVATLTPARSATSLRVALLVGEAPTFTVG